MEPSLCVGEIEWKMNNNTSFPCNKSDDNFEETGWSIHESVAWCAAFLLEALLIILGNSLIIVLFVKNRRLHKRRFYLLVSLAASDLLVGAISIPLWVYYDGGIYIGWKVNLTGYAAMAMEIVDILSLVSSLLTLTAIAIERMCAVTWPFRYETIQRRSYCIVIALIWMASSLFVTVFMITVTLWPSRNSFYYRYIVLILVICISLLIISIAYSCIIFQISCQRNSNPFSNEEDRRLALTLFLVSAVATVTWLMFILLLLLKMDIRTKRVLLFLNYLNGLINPCLYTLRMSDFRKAAFEFVRGKSQTGQVLMVWKAAEMLLLYWLLTSDKWISNR